MGPTVRCPSEHPDLHRSSWRLYVALHKAARYLWPMPPWSAASRNCFTILGGEHVRVMWLDLEAAFEMGGARVRSASRSDPGRSGALRRTGLGVGGGSTGR